MNMLKKTVITVTGGLLVFFGLVFIIIPGPSMLLLLPGLLLLSLEYPIAKSWLKRCQRLMKKTSISVDAWLSKRKYKKYQ